MMDCSNTVSITNHFSPLTVYCVGNPSHLSYPSQHPVGWHTAHFRWPWPYTVSCLMGTHCQFWQRKRMGKLLAELFGGWHQTFLLSICLYPQRVLVLFNNTMRSPWTISSSPLLHGQHEKTADYRKQHPLHWHSFRKQYIFISHRFVPHVYAKKTNVPWLVCFHLCGNRQLVYRIQTPCVSKLSSFLLTHTYFYTFFKLHMFN